MCLKFKYFLKVNDFAQKNYIVLNQLLKICFKKTDSSIFKKITVSCCF